MVGLNPAAQNPFTVALSQTNPTTNQNASMMVNVPNQDRSNQNVNPWPQYLAYNGANITLTGASGNCTVTATVTAAVPAPTLSFGTVTCSNPDPAYQVNCGPSNVCFLPMGF